MHYTHEAKVMTGSVTARKIFYFRRRRDGLSREEFQAKWKTHFFDALTRGANFSHVASRYVQNHALAEADHPDGQATKFFDVIDEIHLRDSSPLALLRENLSWVEDVRRLETEFLEPGRTQALVTETVMNIP
jgi:hypothetical protein